MSAVGHLVDGGERSEDAALVRFYDVSVLDHLVQDDVNSVQVEHDLMMSRGQGVNMLMLKMLKRNLYFGTVFIYFLCICT